MQKIFLLLFISSSAFCMRNGNKSKTSQSQVEVEPEEPQILQLFFGENDQNQKKIEYLKNPVPASKELKTFCPNIVQTTCSKSLLNHLTNQLANAYNMLKIIRVEVQELDAAIDRAKKTSRFFKYIAAEYIHYSEFQNCFLFEQDQQQDPAKLVQEVRDYFSQFIKKTNESLRIFNELRKQMVEYYGGIFCGICDSKMKDYAYWYKDQEYDYLVMQFNQKTKSKLINMLQKVNQMQNHFYKVSRFTKFANCFAGELRLQDAQIFFNIYENAGHNFQEINDGLEKCKTQQTIENFLNQGDMECVTLLSYYGPFNTIDFFNRFDEAYQFIIKSINYIALEKDLKVNTKYKDQKGVMQDFSKFSKEFSFYYGSEYLKPVAQDFQEKGINVVEQNFQYEALRTLSKQFRPGMFDFMKLYLI